MKAKACSRCKKVQPIEAFHHGRSSHCVECRREIRIAWKKSNPAHTAAVKMKTDLNRGNGTYNPLRYSTLHCEHIATYLKRAIERFERNTSNEAPPELTSLYQLAAKLADQQSTRMVSRQMHRNGYVKKTPRTAACVICGAEFTTTQPQRRFCTTTCRYREQEWLRKAGLRRCGVCEQRLPADVFVRSNTGRHRAICKPCHRAYEKQRRQRVAA